MKKLLVHHLFDFCSKVRKGGIQRNWSELQFEGVSKQPPKDSYRKRGEQRLSLVMDCTIFHSDFSLSTLAHFLLHISTMLAPTLR